ncbi:S41 family peptidase [Shewanella gaetbuli]|uniref:Tricorn protease homolog n=1 Tax=Shewanella gaetbuli TaxID=220752 RepID=A0A9X2CKW6_9GAMM|nr:S41 family peptidase [Shewanella gaetbuli]MCL1142054.1 S41 family peptidase [Shewanella gaetbuli]
MKCWKYFLIGLFILISNVSMAAQLLRQPTLNNDLLVFTYANDIWKVPLAGGNAVRVTSFQGQETFPKISPDGKWIAFTGEYAGNKDVYLVSTAGSEMKRLTYHPSLDQAVGWSNDSQTILFRSQRSSAPRPWERLYKIDINGGNPIMLPMNRAFDGSFSPDSTQLVYRRSGLWDKGWRNYRGGQNQALRVISLTDNEEYDLPFNNDLEIAPVWQNDEIYFLSNRSKNTNVYKYSLNAKDVTQVTQTDKFDVMGFTVNGDNLVYEYHGDLYHKQGSAAAKKININVQGDFYWARDKYVDATKQIFGFDISPNAKRVAFEARGDIFTVPVEFGSMRNLTNSAGSREVSPSWSHDGQSIAWFSDDSGEYKLVVADQLGKIKQEITLAGKGYYSHLVWSPDNKRLIFSDNFQQLWVANVTNSTTKIVDQNIEVNPEPEFMASWSPDSKWVAYAKQKSNFNRQLFIYSIDSQVTQAVTDGIAEIRSPVWDKNGQRIYFLASTNYGPKSAWLDMSTIAFNPTFQLYYALLNSQHDSPILPKSDEEKPQKSEVSNGKSDKKKQAETTVKVSVGLAEFNQRILPLSSESGHFSHLKAGKSGELFFLSNYSDSSGSPKVDLIRYNLEERKIQVIASDVKEYRLSASGEFVLVKSNETWKVFDSATGSSEEDKVLNVKLAKQVNYQQEWQQIFREAWRYQRDYLYVDNFHGADWQDVYNTYSPLVKWVKHPADLTYLLDNIGAEVSVGHSFTMSGEMPEVANNQIGLLGVDFELDIKGVRLAKVYTGERYFHQENNSAPLAKIAHKINQGDYLLEVNGQKVDPKENIYQYFEGTLGQQTQIVIGQSPNKTQSFNVIPIADDTALRRNHWVEQNRKYVDEKSNGKLAYVWVPDTAEEGYHSFNRYFYSQSDKQGVIIDERFNHGGYIANYIIDVLRRDLNGFFNNPFNHNSPLTSPGSGIWGSQVMLINEVSGSGGDMLPYLFRHYKLGKLIGKRTWGGLVGIWGVPPLMDGGYITAPRSGFYDLKANWKVENEGVEPDINVEQWTKLTAKGQDPQLDEAITEALKGLKNYQSPILAQPEPPIRVPNPQ